MIEDTPNQYKVRVQKHAEKTLGAVAQAAQAAGVACETVQVEHEHPHQAIIDTAGSKDCDLIVMASHGRHGIIRQRHAGSSVVDFRALNHIGKARRPLKSQE